MTVTGPTHIRTCDQCGALATHITHHERPNTGPLTAYWCDRHFIANQRPTDDAPEGDHR